MGIKIEKINVKNLGPIQNFSEKFGLFNIVYSKNERGKTFLTEFIIRSLFKNIKRWKFRGGGRGKVHISGLGEKIVEFSPAFTKKLEDFWEEEEIGLPPSLVKLLISKGAEPSIEDGEECIGKNLMKEVFSGISLLDKIDHDDNISKTIKDANLLNGNIDISKRGEGKKYFEIREDLDSIDNLFSEIEEKYGQGLVESYRMDEKLLKERLEKIKKAKRYEAYLISEKIKELNKKLNENSDDILNDLTTELKIYNDKKDEYNKRQNSRKELNKESKHFDWLNQALPIYEKLTINYVEKPRFLLLIIAAILFIATIVFVLLNIKIAAIIALVLAIILCAFYIKKIFSYSKFKSQNEELDRIKKEFKNRTDSELTNIATLKSELENQKRASENANILDGQLRELENEKDNKASYIREKFFSLTNKDISEDEWQVTLNGKKTENKNLKREIEEERSKLTNLGISEADYFYEDIGVKFNYDEFEEVSTSLDELSEKIEKQEREIDDLKHEVCNETKSDLSIDWEKLLGNLKEKRIEKQNELELIEAKIIAGINVHKIINQLREEEDKKILEGLQSKIVLEPLINITNRYNKLKIVEDELIVSDDFNNFSLRDLSTGAKEQIMLALRIGFTSKLLKKDTLFLILDDAFQHSDWDRREILINNLKGIAEFGWQVIYLTMDDHILGLFDKIGKKYLKNEYKRIIINN
jgi:Ca2+/Na+ antiporter